jgi:uncharacterized protein YdbL (DUF1318 family)
MDRRFFMMTVLAGAMGLLSTAARGDELSDLQARFKERYPKLLELRNAGTLGETWEGWVEAVKETTAETAALVAMENADRKKLYAIIGGKQGVNPDEVGRRNAIRIFKSAEPEHYLTLKEGKWVQRKDVKLEE